MRGWVLRGWMLMVCAGWAWSAGAGGAATGDSQELVRRAWALHQAGTDDQSQAEARTLYSRAAEAGEPLAWFNLGVMAQQAGDTAAAIQWFKNAVREGIAEGNHNLAVIAAERGDWQEAVRRYRRAAMKGVRASQLNLAVLYHQGQVVAQDVEEAAVWYELAWESGMPEGAFGLADLAEAAGQEGRARDWMHKAAEAGYWPAQARYGFYLSSGVGGEVNLPQAQHWLDTAWQATADPTWKRRIGSWKRAVELEVTKTRRQKIRPRSVGMGVIVSPAGKLLAPVSVVNRAQGLPLRAWIPPGTYVAVHVEAHAPHLGVALLSVNLRTPDYLPLQEAPFPVGSDVRLLVHDKQVQTPLPHPYSLRLGGRMESMGQTRYSFPGALPEHFAGAPILHPQGGVGALVVPAPGQDRRLEGLSAGDIRHQWPELPSDNPRQPDGERERNMWATGAVVRLLVEEPLLQSTAMANGQ